MGLILQIFIIYYVKGNCKQGWPTCLLPVLYNWRPQIEYFTSYNRRLQVLFVLFGSSGKTVPNSLIYTRPTPSSLKVCGSCYLQSLLMYLLQFQTGSEDEGLLGSGGSNPERLNVSRTLRPSPGSERPYVGTFSRPGRTTPWPSRERTSHIERREESHVGKRRPETGHDCHSRSISAKDNE